MTTMDDDLKEDSATSMRPHEKFGRCKRFLDYIFGPWAGNPACDGLFPSTESIKQERIRQREVNRYIIHPYSIFRLIWDFAMVLVLLMTMLILPVEVAFYSEGALEASWIAFNLGIDFLFLCDILINLRTGYILSDECVLDGKKIAKIYMKSWFLPDFVSSVSFDYIVLSVTESGNNVVLASTLSALRMVKFISLLRLLRFLRLVRYFDKINEIWHVDPKMLSIFKLIMLILVYAHWNACIQFFVAYLQGFPDTSWVVIADLQHANATVWSRYTHALYRGMSHMISIGYGITPAYGDGETWMVIISMMTGATFYAVFIAHMSAIVMSLDTSGRRYSEKVCEVQDYMHYRRLPIKLQRRVLDYYEYKYQQKFFDEQDIVSERNMSYPLRKEVLMHNCRSLVESVPFLSTAPSEFLVDIIMKLVMHIYFPGEYVVEAGKKGDSMYFIEHGAVDITLPSGEAVKVLKDGAHFGEISLLFVEKRIASVRAVERCSIYRLSKADFDDVLSDYPKMRVDMLDTARIRMRETREILGYDPDKFKEKVRPLCRATDASGSSLDQGNPKALNTDSAIPSRPLTDRATPDMLTETNIIVIKVPEDDINESNNNSLTDNQNDSNNQSQNPEPRLRVNTNNSNCSMFDSFYSDEDSSEVQFRRFTENVDLPQGSESLQAVRRRKFRKEQPSYFSF